MSGWAKLPHELREELVRGDITLRQFTVACFLLSAIDAGRRGEAAYTGRALADALHWKQSPEYLRRTLVDLRDGGWFVFSERTRGDRSPYLLRYGPKLTRNLQLGTSEESLEVGLGEANLQLTGLLELEVDVQQAEVAGPASPHEDRIQASPDLQLMRPLVQS